MSHEGHINKLVLVVVVTVGLPVLVGLAILALYWSVFALIPPHKIFLAWLTADPA